MRKSFNKYRREYRVEMYDPVWKIRTKEFIDKRTLEYAKSNNNIQGFTYEPVPYRLYFVKCIEWKFKSYLNSLLLKKKEIIKQRKQPTAKPPRKAKRSDLVMIILTVIILASMYIIAVCF